ncbi:MAG: HEAT repeat domain-containing protein [Thermodesulfobacteriota bacterium]
MPSNVMNALILVILIGALLILGILFAAVWRRAAAAGRYRRLDRYRDRFREEIKGRIDARASLQDFAGLVFRHGSTKWQAVEDVLIDLAEDGRYEAVAYKLYDLLGYRLYYEGRLGGNAIARSGAADRLGRMHCSGSTGKLVRLLAGKEPEVVAVAVRSLSRIGTPEALEAVLERLPELLSRSLVTKKSIETSLRNFGAGAVPELIRHGRAYSDPVSRASVLEVLERLAPRDAVPFALENLESADPEVRAKALKVAGAGDGILTGAEKDRILLLLDDPVWFVRLQAAKALGRLRHRNAEPLLAKRLRDGKWLVRNAAAASLIQSCGNPADIFLDVLKGEDRYARDSVCEEVERTGFLFRLIEDMGRPEGEIRRKSGEILKLMDSLGYGSPIRKYLEEGPDERIRKELSLLLAEEGKT